MVTSWFFFSTLSPKSAHPYIDAVLWVVWDVCLLGKGAWNSQLWIQDDIRLLHYWTNFSNMQNMIERRERQTADAEFKIRAALQHSDCLHEAMQTLEGSMEGETARGEKRSQLSQCCCIINPSFCSCWVAYDSWHEVKANSQWNLKWDGLIDSQFFLVLCGLVSYSQILAALRP